MYKTSPTTNIDANLPFVNVLEDHGLLFVLMITSNKSRLAGRCGPVQLAAGLDLYMVFILCYIMS